MLDLAEALLLVWALAGSAVRRDAAAVVASLLATYVAACDLRVALAGPAPDAEIAGLAGGHVALLSVYVGPRMIPFRSVSGWPFSGIVCAHPVLASAVAVAGLVAAIAWAIVRERKLRPEIPEAMRLARLQPPLVAVAIVETIHALVWSAMWMLVDRTSG